MRYLYLIPARAGSKRLPNKNVALLAGKPLLFYSLELARTFTSDHDILISTDDQDILTLCQKSGYRTDYVRKPHLATDKAGMDDVIRDGISYMSSINKVVYDAVILLQPTSPLRKPDDIQRCMRLFEETEGLDMVTTACESRISPYTNLFYEVDGKLEKFIVDKRAGSRSGSLVRLNGAVYIIRVDSINQSDIPDFKNIRSHLMPPERSVDIDEEMDWILAEALINKNH
ncbi:MAG: acylneuraminate cytidylyltransferase family protein [Salibacteraceae bacterium]